MLPGAAANVWRLMADGWRLAAGSNCWQLAFGKGKMAGGRWQVDVPRVLPCARWRPRPRRTSAHLKYRDMERDMELPELTLRCCLGPLLAVGPGSQGAS